MIEHEKEFNLRYVAEATEKGLTIISEGTYPKYIYRRNICGHIFEANPSSIRHNKCSTCAECTRINLRESEIKFGLTLIEKISNIKNKYRIELCGHHIELYKANVVRQEFVKCPICEANSFELHLDKYGLELIEYRTTDNITHSTKDKVAKLRFKACGHETNRIRTLSKGYAPCSECADANKKGVFDKNGLQFVSKVSNVKSLFRFKECGHERVVYDSAALRGNCLCQECNESSFNKKSKLYIIRIVTEDDNEFLKFGYGKDIVNRVREYRMKGVKEHLIIFEKDCESGTEAMLIEKAVHKALKGKTLSSLITKTYLTRGGFTECYPIYLLDTILKEIQDVERGYKIG